MQIRERKVLKLISIPEQLTKNIWVPELPSKVTFGFVKQELIPTLFSQIRQCNKQLFEIRKLRVNESD